MPLLLMIRQNAQLVVERLEPILGGRRLFYFDSEGELSELLVQDGKFAGFAALQFQGGVCRHCGCSDADPCRFGRYRACSWIDPLHTVCSNASCVQAEIDSLFELIVGEEKTSIAIRHIECVMRELLDRFPDVMFPLKRYVRK